MPKSAQSGATTAMQEIYNAEDRAHAVPLARGHRSHLIALVRSGAKFESGVLAEREEDTAV